MRPVHSLFSVLAGLALLGSAAQADELQLANPPATASPSTSQSSVNHPARGMSMQQVEATFGAPTNRVPAVGGGNAHQPPITRWEYPGFTVYFENDKVVHSVIAAG